MELVFGIALRGVVAPATLALALAAAAVLATRRSGARARRFLPEAAVALGVGAGAFLGLSLLAGAPPWPPVDSVHRLGWVAAGGAVLGALDAWLLSTPRRALRRVRALLPAAAAGALPAFLLRADGVDGPAVALALGAVSLWGLLDLLATRTSGTVFAFLLGGLAAGSAAVVALGRTALTAQVAGALAAAVGGAALVSIVLSAARRREVSLRSAAVPVAFAVASAAAVAVRYASLAPEAALLLLGAPAAALAATFALAALPSRGPRSGVLRLRLVPTLPVVALAASLAAVASVAATSDPDDPDASPIGSDSTAEPDPSGVAYGYESIGVSP